MHPRVKAFADAGRGVLAGLRTQPHLRFHVFAAVGVLLCGHLIDAKGEKLPAFAPLVIFVLFALVMSLELVNSAVEAACDAITTQHHPLIGAAKDMAAGAVLVAAVAAAGLGAWLLAPPLLGVFFCKPGLLNITTLPAVAATLVLYVAHHFLAQRRLAWVLGLLCLWGGGVVAVASRPWVGVPLLPVIALGLYGQRRREVKG